MTTSVISWKEEGQFLMIQVAALAQVVVIFFTISGPIFSEFALF
jgi:hypothetical protein